MPYDVSRGVTLAKKYEEKHIKNIKKDGVWVSEKLDGIRACWTGSKLKSRVNKPIYAPQWFLDELPDGLPLDGELYIDYNMFNETSSVVRKKVPVDEEWKRIKYCVFDSPSTDDTPFEKRMDDDFFKKDHLFIRVIDNTLVYNEDDLLNLYKMYLDKGAEGIMIRIPNKPYENKRTSNLTKMKPVEDFEVLVYGYEKGQGKYVNMLGALHVHLIGNDSVKFKVGTGLNDELRTSYTTSIPIGCRVTISYQSINEKTGVPRFPVFKGVRSVD